MKRILAGTGIIVLAISAWADSGTPENAARGPNMGSKMMGGSMGHGGMMGPGMTGHGMMEGCAMMGSAMMGPRAFDGLDLTADQRSRIATILSESRRKDFKAMEEMHEQAWKQGEPKAGAFDEASARKAFESEQQIRKQMFETELATRRQLDAVLTPEQRAKLPRE